MAFPVFRDEIIHQRFFLPASLQRAWKHILAVQHETQQQWFERKVHEEVDHYAATVKHPHAEGAE